MKSQNPAHQQWRPDMWRFVSETHQRHDELYVLKYKHRHKQAGSFYLYTYDICHIKTNNYIQLKMQVYS